MKIAILTPTFLKYSGPDRVVENEANEYSENGHQVTVFTFRADIKSSKYNIIELNMPANRTLERIYRLFFFFDVLKIIRVVKILRKYDEIISFLYPVTILAATANKYYKKKYVYYNVGVAYPELFSSFEERLYMRLFRIFTNFTIKNADSSISISKFLKTQLKAEVGLDSKVKYVAISNNEFNGHLSKKKIATVAKKHNLKKPVLLFVGRISPHKGVHLLLQSFKIIQKQIPSATLLIVGKPTFDAYSKKLLKISNSINKSSRRNSVIFAGFVPDHELPYYFGASTLYTTATLWEGFDMPVVQAQMCNKKVVAFDVGSHPEVVKNGILVPKGDVVAMSKAIIKLLKTKFI